VVLQALQSRPTFLQAKKNSVSRERMYFHKLAFDLQLAAAEKNYPLQIFEPEMVSMWCSMMETTSVIYNARR